LKGIMFFSGSFPWKPISKSTLDYKDVVNSMGCGS
jgi:hypothetical protein